MTPVHVTMARSIHQVNAADWAHLCPPEADLLMHPGLLAAAEAALGPGTAGAAASRCETRFWYLLAYHHQRPVGAACVTEYPVDVTVFASRLAQRIVAAVRRLWPGYLRFRATFCGLPISTAGSNLRVVPDCDTGEVVAALHDTIAQIARQRRTWLMVYKELDDEEAARLAPLEAAGFVRAESLPMNRVANRFGGFDAMLSSMRSHYRYKISRSRRKFSQSGLAVRRRSGRAAMESFYTPALHRLYEEVARRAEHRLEILPREFFLELSSRFPDELTLTTVEQGSRVLAYAWSIAHGGVYRNLFVGIDYERNEPTDAYFNLMIEDIAHGLSHPVRDVYVGQTADEFKSRLGCTAARRFLYIKATRRWLQWCLRTWESSLLTPPCPAPRRDVFKQEPAGGAAARC